MTRQCEFIMGAHDELDAHGIPTGNPIIDLCDVPASIRRDGRWYCAEHYDTVENGGEKPTVVRNCTSTSVIF